MSHALAAAAVLTAAGVPMLAHGQNDSGGAPSYVADLVCPNEAVRPPGGTTTPHIPPPPNAGMPTLAELGDLAHPVTRDQPVFDTAQIPDFALQDGASSTPRPRRFAFWGDSHIAAGPFMKQVQQAILDRGETVGLRFLPPTMGRANVRLPVRASCIGHGWSTELAFTAPNVVQVGPGLANRTAQAGGESYLWLDLRDADRQPVIRQVQIAYRPTGAPAEITYSINDGPEQRATLAAGDPAAAASALVPIAGSPSISTLKLHVSAGQIVLQGFVLDYVKPPQVTFDVFGLPSSTARGWAMTDPAFLAQTLHGDSYDAVVLEYGTNEGNDTHYDRITYSAGLFRTLTKMRYVFPNASCVLVGPPDRGILIDRSGRSSMPPDLLKYARIHQEIEAVQADVGKQFGCVAWNWQDLMGGPGGNYGWFNSEPVLMGRDLTHLTAAGYRRTGLGLARSLGWAAPER